MQKSLIVIAIMLIATPSAFATWGAKGNFEPDTKLDATGGYMYANADQVLAGHKVYFNAIQGYNLPLNTATPLSANLATLQTQQMSTPYQAMALLGVWKDCNKDGFIGLGDNGLFEYRASLLLDPSICPKQAPPVTTTDGLVHNDGTWIHEFIPIGYDSEFALGTPGGATNKYKVEDVGARVWGDFGIPGAPAGAICWINPSPPGSYHTVGQIEDKMDCYAGNAIANAVGSSGGATYTSVRATRNPWGETTDSSNAVVFDCASPIIAEKQVQSFHFGVRAPKVPPTVSTAGSPSGTAREVGNELDDCNPSNDITDNSWEYQVSNLAYSQESGRVSAQKAGQKIQADQVFKFNQGNRGVFPFSAVLGAASNTDAGTNTYFAFGIWKTNSLCTTCNQYSRGQLSGTSSLRVQHQTYYAFISPGLLSSYGGISWPKGASTSVYGFEACGSATFGIVGGWDCDKSHWYKNVDGTSSNPGEPLLGPNPDPVGNPSDSTTATDPGAMPMGARVGDPYNLRDVDCFDQSVGPARNAGVSYGTLTTTTCA